MAEADLARVALKQAHAQLLLQLAYALAQRGLGHVQAVGRTGKALFLGHGQKTTQMPEFHALLMRS